MLCLYGLDAGVVGILAATAPFNQRDFAKRFPAGSSSQGKEL